jgi:hypothetical protein
MKFAPLGDFTATFRLRRRKIGGFWGEQPGAGGTAHFGTVARPTSYYDFWKAKFPDFFCRKRGTLNEGGLRDEKSVKTHQIGASEAHTNWNESARGCGTGDLVLHRILRRCPRLI